MEASRLSESSVEIAALPQGSFMGLLLLIILLVLFLGAWPTWGHSKSWGYGPSGLLGLILIVIVVLWITGNLHLSV